MDDHRQDEEPQAISGSAVRISIALVTRNRPASLERALQSWRRQEVQPFEIVVSDDSDDGHRGGIAKLVAKYRAKYLVGPRRGLYANRNAIVVACTGTHILSADDDHEHPEGFLATVMRAAQLEPNTVWCIGEYHSWEDFKSGGQLHSPGQLSPHGTLSPIAGGADAQCWAISDGATLYPRGIFDAGLRFYEGVKFGASYCEFGCLVNHLRWRIRPLPGTAVIHHLHETPRSYNNPKHETAASLFAAFMYSFYYQPTLRHAVVTLSKVPANLIKHPTTAIQSIALAIAHVRIRLRELERLRTLPARTDARQP